MKRSKCARARLCVLCGAGSECGRWARRRRSSYVRAKEAISDIFNTSSDVYQERKDTLKLAGQVLLFAAVVVLLHTHGHRLAV